RRRRPGAKRCESGADRRGLRRPADPFSIQRQADRHHGECGSRNRRMFGAVFAVELLRAGRRGRGRGLRSLYAGWLMLKFFADYDGYHDAIVYPRANTPPPADATARFATDFADFILLQHFVLLVLVTPAFVAGAVTDEKTR